VLDECSEQEIKTHEPRSLRGLPKPLDIPGDRCLLSSVNLGS